MIKIPTYIDCLAKVVSYLGLDYSEEENKTGKFRVKEQKTFFNQGKSYTEQYVPKILDLFAGEDEAKRQFISAFLAISENLARDLTSENYRTLANNKRAMWGLCVFYYIPHISCLITLYKFHHGLPNVLIEKNFMLPFRDKKRNIELPAMRLKKYLKSILTELKQNTSLTEYVEQKGSLEDYIHKMSSTVIPSYGTLYFLVKQLGLIPMFEHKVSEISLVFRSAIISASIFSELLKLFESEDDVMSLVDYFNASLKSGNLSYKNINVSHSNSFFQNYHIHYQVELSQTLIQQRKCFIPDANGQPLQFKNYAEYKYSKKITFGLFDALLVNTTFNTANDLFKVDIKNLIENVSNQSKDKSDCHALSDAIDSMDKVECMYHPSSSMLNSKDEHILRESKNHRFYHYYKDQYLYCDALNDLAKNDFKGAIKKLEEALEICRSVTVGVTQIKVVEKLIILHLIDASHYNNFDNLNYYIKTIIDAQKQKGTLIIPSNLNSSAPYVVSPSDSKEEKQEKEKSKLNAIYLQKVLDIIKSFNEKGYARYEGIECVKINPFEKVEQFVKDFYDLYDIASDTESEESKIEVIIKKLTKDRGAKYKLDSNLVTLNSFKPLDVFEPDNFTHIAQFYFDSKIESENIVKLKEDFQTLERIFSTLSTLCAPDKPTLIPCILHVDMPSYSLHI